MGVKNADNTSRVRSTGPVHRKIPFHCRIKFHNWNHWSLDQEGYQWYQLSPEWSNIWSNGTSEKYSRPVKIYKRYCEDCGKVQFDKKVL